MMTDKKSPIALAIREKFGWSMVTYADRKGISHNVLLNLACGRSSGKYGEALKIKQQLKKDRVWREVIRG